MQRREAQRLIAAMLPAGTAEPERTMADLRAEAVWLAGSLRRGGW